MSEPKMGVATTAADASLIKLDPAIIEMLVLYGDLKRLTPVQTVAYYNYKCQQAGLDPAAKPFDLLELNGKRLLYANAGATQQLTNNRKLSHQITNREIQDGVYCVFCRVSGPDGRSTENMGAVPIEGLKGEAKANAMLKATTKAIRRSVLAHCGLGVMDEEEVETIPGAVKKKWGAEPDEAGYPTRVEDLKTEGKDLRSATGASGTTASAEPTTSKDDGVIEAEVLPEKEPDLAWTKDQMEAYEKLVDREKFCFELMGYQDRWTARLKGIVEQATEARVKGELDAWLFAQDGVVKGMEDRCFTKLQDTLKANWATMRQIWKKGGMVPPHQKNKEAKMLRAVPDTLAPGSFAYGKALLTVQAAELVRLASLTGPDTSGESDA